MSSQSTSTSEFKATIPFCRNTSQFWIKFALISSESLVFPQSIQIALVIIEYLQLISQGLLIADALSITLNSSGLLENSQLLVSSLFNPGKLLDVEIIRSSSITGILIGLSCITLIKYIACLYVFIIAHTEKPGQTHLLKLWSFIFKTQNRVGYYFITSFWVQILTAISQDSFPFEYINRTGVTALCIVMILLEFGLGLVPQILLPYRLPAKNHFFSRKDNVIEIITLIQKFVIQMLNANPNTNTLSIAWAYTSVNTVLSVIRMMHFYQVLPYYKIKALYLHAVILTIVSCMSFAYSTETVVRSIEKSDIMDRYLALGLWIITTIPAIKLALGYLDKVLIGLITKKKERSPEMLVHKIAIIKYILKRNYTANDLSVKYKRENLLSNAIAINLEQVFSLDTEGSINITSKDSINQMFIAYLENMYLKMTKSSFLKLYLAYFYGKKLKQYGKSLQLLTLLQRNFESTRTKLNVSLLMHDMQANIIIHNDQSDKIDIYTYIQATKALGELKEKMVKQAVLQVQLCEQLKETHPNLPEILKTGKKVNRLSLSTKKQAKKLLRNIPNYYLEPLALYAQYSLILNHSIKTYQKYYKEYDALKQRHEQVFHADKLCRKNIYQEGLGLFIISGQKEDIATVVYSSQTAQLVYGRKMIGEKASSLVIPSLQGQHYQSIKAILEQGDPQIMGKPIRVFMHMKEGYMELYDYYMNMSPFLSQGLYYIMVTRKVPTTKEYIVLNEDGTIDCCTRDLGYKLGILQQRKKGVVNIGQISKELERVSKSYNIMACTEKYKGTSMISEMDLFTVNSEEIRTPKSSNIKQRRVSIFQEVVETKPAAVVEAEKVFELYSNEGKTVTLKSINDVTRTYLYHCKIENQMHGELLLKVLTLERVGGGEAPQMTPLESAKAKDLVAPQFKTENTRVNTTEFLVIKTNEDSHRRPLIKRQSVVESFNEGGVRKVDAKDDRQSVSTKTSSSMQQTKISKTFTEAVKIRYYTRFYKVFLVLWYVTLGGMMANQIQLTVQRGSQISGLQEKKDLLRSAHLQIDALITIHMHIRSLYRLINTPSSLPVGSIISLQLLYDLAETEIANLKRRDNNLLEGAGSLKEEDRAIVFETDVRIFEPFSENYMSMNIFHAVKRLVEESSAGLLQTMETGFTQIADFNVVFRNNLDDSLMKSDDTAHLFLHEIELYDAEILHGLDINVSTAVAFMGLLAGIFVSLVHNRYKNETKNMLAFVKLDQIGVDTVQQRIINFKRNVVEDQEFERLQGSDMLNYYDSSTFKRDNATGFKAKSASKRTAAVGYKGLSKKFFIYGFVTIFLLAIIVTLIYVSHILADKSIEGTEKNLSQLIFSDDLKLNVSLVLATMMDLMTDTNSATYIMNSPVSLELLGQINGIPELITEAPGEFKESNGDYDPVMQDILFGNPCLYVDAQWQNSCNEMRNGASIMGAIKILDDLLLYIRDTEILIEENGTLPDPEFSIIQNLVLRSVFAAISAQLDNNFNSRILKGIATNHAINAVITITIAIVCVLVHIKVLKRMGDSDNKFKEVLKTFPATLVLSNFLLKSYLLRTSKGVMLAIKDNI